MDYYANDPAASLEALDYRIAGTFEMAPAPVSETIVYPEAGMWVATCTHLPTGTAAVGRSIDMDVAHHRAVAEVERLLGV